MTPYSVMVRKVAKRNGMGARRAVQACYFNLTRWKV